jgi:uncharacterized protein
VPRDALARGRRVEDGVAQPPHAQGGERVEQAAYGSLLVPISPLSVSALLLLAGVSFAAGLVDAIAGGGGLLTVPALLAVGLPPHLALATNKGQATFGAVSSFVSFWRSGGVDRPRVPIAFTCGLVGSLAGASLVLLMSPESLRPVVLALLVIAALIVVSRRSLTPAAVAVASPRAALGAMAFAFGAYDGFFGPGVGSMLIVANALLFGDGLTRASGNAKVVNLASNLAALGLFAARGMVLWQIALPMAAANALGAAVGVRLAVRRGDRFVRAVVLLVVLTLVTKLAVDIARGR